MVPILRSRAGPGGHRGPPLPAHRPKWLLAAATLSTLLLGPLSAVFADENGSITELCLDCHAYMEGEMLEIGDGAIDLGVPFETWASSVHAEELGCTSCHRGITDYPHPELTAASARTYVLEQSETCSRCHYAYHTRLLDSMHYEQLESGNLDAPTCVDCHGAHDTTNPREPRIGIDRRCARCHEDISTIYAQSVHGRALIEDGNPDVPVCTDCHGSHAIIDPRTVAFHARQHLICAPCHSDEERMARYDLSPNVLNTYLDDFHGRSNQLYAEGAGEPGQPMATCTDCHGVHDIQSFDQGGGKEGVRARVAEVCRDCHEEVPDRFADAWLYHYEPTLSSAPLVWGVTWAYRLLIPFILAGLVLHILLHLWRVRTHR